jgi:hypothetical protein
MRRSCTHPAVGGGVPRGGGVVVWLPLPEPTRAAGHSAVLSAPALAAGVLPAATHGADVGAGPLEQGSEGGPARTCRRVRICKGPVTPANMMRDPGPRAVAGGRCARGIIATHVVTHVTRAHLSVSYCVCYLFYPFYPCALSFACALACVLPPRVDFRLSTMATTRGNLSPQAGFQGVRMTAATPSDVSEDPELWKGTQTLDNQVPKP